MSKIALVTGTSSGIGLSTYQTSDFSRGVAAQVRVDPTGALVLRATNAQLG